MAESLRRRRRGKVGRSWYVDETYIKVHGQWRYLYRAIDRSGALVEVMFSEHRDMAAAKAFFESAKMTIHHRPARSSTAAISAIYGFLVAAARRVRYARQPRAIRGLDLHGIGF
jgi:transposase-like protein